MTRAVSAPQEHGSCSADSSLERDEETRAAAPARLVTFPSMSVCRGELRRARSHLTPSATSITFYFQPSARLLIGIIYCCFMRRVLQVVQSLTPQLAFNACAAVAEPSLCYSLAADFYSRISGSLLN